ncbi:MAG: HAMP domain-containing sensor histidine kinase [Pirellulales bacterium]
MQPQAVAPHEVAEQVVYEQRRVLEQRGIRCDLDPTMPPVMIHPARLKQILTNLIRNAARHGCAIEHPHIVVRTATPPAGETADRVWLSVADNGAGIPAAMREEIFLPGKRLANAHAEGSGMGLAIVKKIVDHYEGRILVDPLAAGTSFVFSLPRAE